MTTNLDNYTIARRDGSTHGRCDRVQQSMARGDQIHNSMRHASLWCVLASGNTIFGSDLCLKVESVVSLPYSVEGEM